jgi:hypothetical protein
MDCTKEQIQDVSQPKAHPISFVTRTMDELFSLGVDPSIWESYQLIPATHEVIGVHWNHATYSNRLRLAERLQNVKDLREILRIIEEFREQNELVKPKEIVKRKNAELGPKLTRAFAKQGFVKGIVKILFAPLKINLESLHPTKSFA